MTGPRIIFNKVPRLELTTETATDLFRRLEMAVAEVRDHPEYYDPTVEIRVDLIADVDAFPEGDLAEQDYVAIPYADHDSGEGRHVWVFVDENYVTADGEVRFE